MIGLGLGALLLDSMMGYTEAKARREARDEIWAHMVDYHPEVFETEE